MIKQLLAIVAFGALVVPGTSSADLSSKAPLVDRDVQVDRADLGQFSSYDNEKAGQEEWYPTCLAFAISDTISGVSSCTDAWFPGCLAGSVIAGVEGIQDCGL